MLNMSPTFASDRASQPDDGTLGATAAYGTTDAFAHGGYVWEAPGAFVAFQHNSSVTPARADWIDNGGQASRLGLIVARHDWQLSLEKQVSQGARRCVGAIFVVMMVGFVILGYPLWEKTVAQEEEKIVEKPIRCEAKVIHNGLIEAAPELEPAHITCNDGFHLALGYSPGLVCRLIKKTCLKHEIDSFKPEYAFTTEAAANAAVDISRHEVDASREFARNESSMLTESSCIKNGVTAAYEAELDQVARENAAMDKAAIENAMTDQTSATAVSVPKTAAPSVPRTADSSSTQQGDANDDQAEHRDDDASLSSPSTWTPRTTLAGVLALALAALVAVIAAGVSRGRSGCCPTSVERRFSTGMLSYEREVDSECTLRDMPCLSP